MSGLIAIHLAGGLFRPPALEPIAPTGSPEAKQVEVPVSPESPLLGLSIFTGLRVTRPITIPDPDRTAPDPANTRGMFLPSGPFYQDTTMTVLATTGQNVKAWFDASGNGCHLLWSTGAVPTAAVGGGIFLPLGAYLTSTASAPTGTWSLYVWSDGPNPAALNHVAGEGSGYSNGIFPHHLTDRTYFGSGGTYDFIADTPTEKLRGMSAFGGTIEAFCGGSQSQLSLSSAAFSSLKIGEPDPTFQYTGTVRFVSLRDVSDGQPLQNAHKRFAHRLLNPINPNDDVIRVAINIHYEGLVTPAVGSPNNNAHVLMRARVPFSKLTHCFSAGYELLGNSHATVAAGFNPLFHDLMDVIGMHIHWIFELPTACGITIIDHPTIGGALVPDGNGGYNTLSTAYNLADHRIMCAYVKSIIETYGKGSPKIFVCGNWITCDDLLQALKEIGFEREVSVLPPALATMPLFTVYTNGIISSQWPNATTDGPGSQAYMINTPAGQMKQFVSNIGMTSYGTDQEMLDRLIALADGQLGVISNHENDPAGWAQLATVLESFEAHCASNSKRVQYVTIGEA